MIIPAATQTQASATLKTQIQTFGTRVKVEKINNVAKPDTVYMLPMPPPPQARATPLKFCFGAVSEKVIAYRGNRDCGKYHENPSGVVEHSERRPSVFHVGKRKTPSMRTVGCAGSRYAAASIFVIDRQRPRRELLLCWLSRELL
jgi:hypothetical protein